MISLLGNSALYLAFFFALMQSVLPLLGYTRRNPYLLAFARPAAFGQTACVVIAYGLLSYAFASNDFTLFYVAANSHPLLPLMYRLTAIWGAHEGSILLWILLLAGWTQVFAITQRKRTTAVTTFTLAILGLISLCFLSFLIFTSNPFASTNLILSPRDLNPLLQDPGLIIHPPMLYVGYVGLSVAFAITLAALLTKQLDKPWARLTSQFTVAAWCFLTFGIALGSWWAYRVLGWGGFWFWDPVENASLLPWLAGTALIHVMVFVEKRQQAKTWAVLLAIICFALSLLGTFLVRSGVLVSAHTFASDPERGVYLLLLLGVLLTASIALFIIRLPLLNKPALHGFNVFSRETALLLNSALLFIAMLTVLLGTLYPLIMDAFHLGAISVGAPYFNLVMLPLACLTLLLMGIAPWCKWGTQSGQSLWLATRKNALLSILITFVVLYSITEHIHPLPFLSLTLSVWVILSAIAAWRVLPNMSLAHLGFAVLMIGILFSSLLNQERDVRMSVGDIAQVGPYQFLFISVQGTNGSNYRGIRAAFDVTKQGRHITNLYPEKLLYPVRERVMTKVAIHPGLFRDLYLALGQPLDDTTWTVRIYYKPFVRWIWAGGLLMMLGGLFSLFRRVKT